MRGGNGEKGGGGRWIKGLGGSERGEGVRYYPSFTFTDRVNLIEHMTGLRNKTKIL